jgi:hypothetical protein
MFVRDWPVSVPKSPELLAVYAIGITPDGRRVVLGSGPEVRFTPAWRGSAVGFFLGG